MTHFVARFPQYSNAIKNPTPQDYLDASMWYRLKCRPGDFIAAKADAFARVYRKLKWARETTGRRIEAERVG